MHENVGFHSIHARALTLVRCCRLRQMLSPQGGREEHTKTQKYIGIAWGHGRHRRKDVRFTT